MKNTVDMNIDFVTDRITRVREMEEIYDRVRKDIATLREYEESGLWQQDYEADEKGELPKELKRGVLSQDGLDEVFDFVPKLFRHFRNGLLYRPVAYATIEATGEEAVVYQAMYGERKLWIRPKSNFFEEVQHEGRMVPRFQPVTDLGDESLLPFCRHYDPDRPEEEQSLMGSYEQKWMEFMKTDMEYVSRLVANYIEQGLEDFNVLDGTPMSLKAILFGRYCYWEPYWTIDDFKDWYKSQYLGKSAEAD